MKLPIKSIIVLLVIGGLAAAAYPLQQYWKERTRIKYRQAEVTRGEIVAVVNATGTVKPMLSVSVGSFVSGPIEKLLVDYNDVVKKGDLLATIDPRLYEANVARDRATLETKKADVDRVKALLQQATNDEERALALRKLRKDFLSDSEMDQFRFNRMSLAAQLAVSKASVDQAVANLKNSEANLAYTEIRSPVDGMVIDRKIDQGQTLAAQFQTPELFIVAPDIRTRMHIIAAVDEADIGLIREAKFKDLPVRFTVDSAPEELFEGKIHQIRMSSTTTQNVVTYPVVVSTSNTELKLFPGMTASLSFQVNDTRETVRIPNSALRFYPAKQQVRKEDRKLLEGVETADDDSADARMTAKEKAEKRRNRNRRHVWVVDGDFLKAIEVITGISDNNWTQLVSGELPVGRKLVTGIQAADEE